MLLIENVFALSMPADLHLSLSLTWMEFFAGQNPDLKPSLYARPFYQFALAAEQAWMQTSWEQLVNHFQGSLKVPTSS